MLEPQRVLAPLLVSRIKVMARLDIAEKRLPQDGRISLRVAGRALDLSGQLRERGLLIGAIRPPTVPAGSTWNTWAWLHIPSS